MTSPINDPEADDASKISLLNPSQLNRSQVVQSDSLPIFDQSLPAATQATTDELSVHQLELAVQLEELLRTQREVQALRARYDDLYDRAPVGYCTVSSAGIIVEANLTLAKLLRLDRHSLVQMPISQIVLAEDQATLFLACDGIDSKIAGKRKNNIRKNNIVVDGPDQESLTVDCEIRLLRADGSSFWAHCVIAQAHHAMESSDGGSAFEPETSLRFVITDINARRIAESSLQLSEQHLKESQSIAQLGSFHWDAHTNRVFWSDETFRVFGQCKETFEPSFEGYIKSIHPSDRTLVEDHLKEAMATLGKFEHEYRAIRPDGTERWLHARGQCVVGSDGKLAGLCGTCQDITDRRIVDSAREELRSRLEKIASRVPGVVYQYRLRPDGTACIPYASEGLREIFGFGPEDVREDASKLVMAHHPDDNEALFAGVKASAEHLSLFSHEFRLRFPDGMLKWLSVNAIPERESDGSTLWHGYITDITDRKNAEAALKRSRLDLNEAQRIAHMGSWHLDLADNQVQWSEELYRMYGFDPANPPPQFSEHESLVAPESWKRLSSAVQLTLNEGTPYELELEIQRPDQRRGWMWVRGEVVRNADGNTIGLRGVAQDITEQKISTEKLQQSETLLRIVTDSARVGLMVLDRDHCYVFVNATYAAILGLSESEMVGRCVRDILPAIYESTIKPRLNQAFAGERVDYQLQLHGANGQVDLVVSYEPVFEGSTVSRVVAVLVDVTTQRSTEEQLRHAQKMEAVGQLAGGIAHDFNNLLTVINGYTDILLRNPAHDDFTRDSLREVKKASDRAAGLTRSLLAFGRRQIRAPEVLDLNEVIRESLNLLQTSVGDGVEIKLSMAPGLNMIQIDRSEMSQVLLNLSINARDAMQNEGQFFLTTENVQVTENGVTGNTELKPGNYILLTASDSGPGIIDAIKNRIFEPFFTTKPVGKGSGLGLSMVHGIVKGSGGAIEVRSVAGQGATFRIFLPQSTAAVALPDAITCDSKADGGEELILLVEDDTSVKQLTSTILSDYGYGVIEASSAQEAVAIFKEHADRIQMLVTDLIMPGMNGMVLAETILNMRPGLPVLFMSGFVDDESHRERILNSTSDFLHKPFMPRQLALKVRNTLNQLR